MCAFGADDNNYLHAGKIRKLRFQMIDDKFIQCSICRRAAAWVIDKEVFCEGHKEVIIETFGVDHFPIHRLTNEDDAFAIGGRFPKPKPKRTVAITPLGGAARCRKS